MGAYRISFTISAAPAITNYFIAVLYKTTAPASEVTRILMGNSHAAPQNASFTGLNAGNYLVKIHESIDNVTLGNLRHDFWIDARTNRIIAERRFYVCDRGNTYDPVNGATTITDPYFDGKTVSGIFQEGYRYLEPVTEWSQGTLGVLSLLTNINTGTAIVCSTNQVWIVEITYDIAMPDVNSNDPFLAIITKTADATLTSLEYNNVISVVGASSSQVTTLPAIGSVPTNKGFMVLHNGGTAVNVEVRAAGGETFLFRGSSPNVIYLAKGEFIKFIKNGSQWYVIEWQGQWARIGEVVDGDMQIDNSLAMDGTEYDGTIYKRAYDFVLNRLPSGSRVNYAGWTGSAQSLFAIDTVSTKFKTPNRLNLSKRALKNIAGTDILRPVNVPGGFQNEMVGPHTHTFFIGNGTLGGNVIPDFNPADGNINRASALTDVNNGSENIVKNFGVLPLMLI